MRKPGRRSSPCPVPARRREKTARQRKARLRQELAAVETTNKALSKRRHLTEAVERLASEAANAEAGHQTLDGVVSGLRELRANLLNGVDLGVPGLEVGAGELRLNGVSFRQASQAEKLRTACAIAVKQNPRLRLVRVDDGEHLDKDGQAMLLRLLDQHDCQGIIAAVKESERLKVEIVERGEAP